MAENGSMSPLKDTTQPVDSEEEGRSSTMDRSWLIEKKSIHGEIALFLNHLLGERSLRPCLIRNETVLTGLGVVT